MATSRPAIVSIIGQHLIIAKAKNYYRMFSEPIALEIVSGTHSYLGTQLFAGLMYVAAAICAFFLRGWKINQDALIEAGIGLDGEGAEDRKRLTMKQKLLNCIRLENV